jgi:hypothetical protein
MHEKTTADYETNHSRRQSSFFWTMLFFFLLDLLLLCWTFNPLPAFTHAFRLTRDTLSREQMLVESKNSRQKDASKPSPFNRDGELQSRQPVQRLADRRGTRQVIPAPPPSTNKDSSQVAASGRHD